MPINLPRRMYVHIDVLCASPNEPNFVPRTKTHPVFRATELAVHGRYRITLGLPADSMSPKLMKLLLTGKGDPLVLSVEVDGLQIITIENLDG